MPNPCYVIRSCVVWCQHISRTHCVRQHSATIYYNTRKCTTQCGVGLGQRLRRANHGANVFHIDIIIGRVCALKASKTMRHTCLSNGHSVLSCDMTQFKKAACNTLASKHKMRVNCEVNCLSVPIPPPLPKHSVVCRATHNNIQDLAGNFED